MTSSRVFTLQTFASWQLTESERSALFKTDELGQSEKAFIRLALLGSIARSLEILFKRENLIQSWLRSPNRHNFFQGVTPLEIFCSGDNADLELIAALLKAWCAGN